MIEAFLSTKKQNSFRSFGQRSVTVRNRKSKKVSLSPATNRTRARAPGTVRRYLIAPGKGARPGVLCRVLS